MLNAIKTFFRWVKIFLRWVWDVRDTLLELVIIGMIWREIHDGNIQYQLLQKMNQNTADTVSAMEQLRQEQAKSLTDMNDTFGKAVGAMRSQLAILRSEQTDRLKAQAKKPHLVMTLAGYQPVNGTIAYFSPESSDVLRLDLKNDGDAPATNSELIIYSDPHVKFGCDCELKRFDPDSEEATGAVSTNVGLIRQGEIHRFRLSLPGTGYYRLSIYFEMNADELPYRTQVGFFRLVQVKR